MENNNYSNNSSIKDFYELTLINFGLEIEFITDGCYKNSPMVIIYSYKLEEIGHPGYNQFRIDVDCHDNKFWFNYKSNSFICDIDLETSQYMVVKALKDIMKMSGIEKELLPELRFKEQIIDKK